MKSDKIWMYIFNMMKYMYIGTMCGLSQIPGKMAFIMIGGFLVLDCLHQFYTTMYYRYRKGN